MSEKSGAEILQLEAKFERFWRWFADHNPQLLAAISRSDKLESEFFSMIMPELRAIHEGIWPLVGLREGGAELIFTADGEMKNIVFVEELVAAAPAIEGWQFSALKPMYETRDMNIDVAGLIFDEQSLSFYARQDANYPDEIDLVIVYKHFDADRSNDIATGVFIFLDHLLGEINATTLIDNIDISGVPDEAVDLIPIHKLKDYLHWREKEFVERYGELFFNSEEEGFSTFEAVTDDMQTLLAHINIAALRWDAKGTHPWLLRLSFMYTSLEEDGLPDAIDLIMMQSVEQQLMQLLPENKGYIPLGHETGDGRRDWYMACKEFRNCSKAVKLLLEQHANINMDYKIYKDKYWQTFERYAQFHEMD